MLCERHELLNVRFFIDYRETKRKWKTLAFICWKLIHTKNEHLKWNFTSSKYYFMCIKIKRVGSLKLLSLKTERNSLINLFFPLFFLFIFLHLIGRSVHHNHAMHSERMTHGTYSKSKIKNEKTNLDDIWTWLFTLITTWISEWINPHFWKIIQTKCLGSEFLFTSL